MKKGYSCSHYIKEAHDQFLKEYGAGLSVNEVSKKIGIPSSTIRNWAIWYFNANGQRKKTDFKKEFIRNQGNISAAANRSGITRQTAARYKKRYYPEVSTGKELFLKLINKDQLSMNELVMLLNTTRATIQRYCKSEGISVPSDLKQENTNNQSPRRSMKTGISAK